MSPELDPHAYPSLNYSSDQINVSDNSESLRSSIFNNLESSGSGIYLPNASGNLESYSSSPSQSLGDSDMILNLGGLYTWRNSFNADAQHSDNLAGASFQFVDVNMGEASGSYSSDKPKRSRGRPKMTEQSEKSKGKQKRVHTPDTPPSNEINNSAKLPHLHDKDAPRGPKYTSVSQWLSDKSKNNSTGNSVLSSPENIPIRTIIPDSASDESTIFEDSDESDGIGVESYASGETEADELDPGLECHDEEPEEEPQKSPSFPPWFKKALEEKLAIIEKRDSNRKLMFYETYETFWVPKKAAWFMMIKAKSLEPEPLYDFELFYWDPELLAKIKCPVCKISWLTRHGLQKIPRRCVGLDKCFWMIGARYKCPTCKNPKTGKHTVTFMSWDSRILAALPKALAAEFPVVLTRRSALSSPILALQRSLFQKGLGAKQFASILTTLHMRRFDQIHLQYLHMIFEGQTQSPWKNQSFRPFSEFSDSQGYSGYIPSSTWFRNLYDSLIEEHLPRIYQYSAMLPARVCAIDHSHKITKHIVTINGVPVFIGLLTVTNEMGEIRVIALVATKAHAQFEIALVNMRE